VKFTIIKATKVSFVNTKIYELELCEALAKEKKITFRRFFRARRTFDI
jgi:hypothetical protein